MNNNLNKRSSKSENLLTVKNLTHVYFQGKKSLKVLDNINFNLKKGEMVALVGPSGSGKTTILNLVGLLDVVQKGEIMLEGEQINSPNLKLKNNIRLNQIGFVFQSHRLLPEFSARENISIPQMLSGLTKNLALKRSDELLEMLGMIEKKHSKPGILSGGEQQRVAIARGLANAPKILLADEPTGNLDPRTADDVFNQLKLIIHNTQLTCLMVTHNFNLAKKMDRIIELNKSKINE
mgnify:FL=1